MTTIVNPFNGPVGQQVGRTDTPNIPYPATFREAVETNLINFFTDQSSFTLAPNGASGYTNTVQIKTNTPQQAGLLVSLVVDATPGQVAIASVGSTINFAQFGIAGNSSQLILTNRWVGRNIIPHHIPIIMMWTPALQFTFTNASNYDAPVDVTWQVGVVRDRRIMANIMRNYLGMEVE